MIILNLEILDSQNLSISPVRQIIRIEGDPNLKIERRFSHGQSRNKCISKSTH
jgi:hypothetical protein